MHSSSLNTVAMINLSLSSFTVNIDLKVEKKCSKQVNLRGQKGIRRFKCEICHYRQSTDKHCSRKLRKTLFPLSLINFP